MPSFTRRAATVLALALLGGPALAHDFKAGALTIDHPTITPTRGTVAVNAGYMTILNAGRQADRLVSASSPAAQRIEIHTHVSEGGMMRMRPVNGGVAIPARGKVAFQPGGLHLMIFGVSAPVRVGDAVDLDLIFEKAGRVRVTAIGEAASTGAHSSHRH
jgi:periplasmic copper chaperone A